jgi:hypothetical protein
MQRAARAVRQCGRTPETQSAFPSIEEARQHIAEGLGHLRRAEWRYSIEGLDPHSLESVYCE